MQKAGRTVVVLLLLGGPVFFLTEEASALGVTMEPLTLSHGTLDKAAPGGVLVFTSAN